MRYPYVYVALVLMAGCASNAKTAIAPNANSDQSSQPQAVVSTVEKPAATVASEVATVSPAGTLNVLEVQHKETSASAAESGNLKASQPGFDPYQWLMAWARGVQENLNPLRKACETNQQKN